jgi:hypothetical protein
MIFTEQKPLDEILGVLEGHEKLFLMGCGICAATWGTGGRKEVEEMAARLSEAGKTCTDWLVTDEAACDARIMRREVRRHKAAIEAADALLMLTCGVGVQTVAALVDKPVYPALNTLYLGRLQRLTLSDQLCRLCGECVLAETGGICPVTLCPKGLTNGPCGGYEAGKCEVDRTRDCAWVLIYRRMEALGQLDRFHLIRPPKDYRRMLHPQSIDKRARG